MYKPFTVPNRVMIAPELEGHFSVSEYQDKTTSPLLYDSRRGAVFIVANCTESAHELVQEWSRDPSAPPAILIVAEESGRVDPLPAIPPGLRAAVYRYSLDSRGTELAFLEGRADSRGVPRFRIGALDELEKVVYLLSNALYRMGRWFWEEAESLNSSDKDEQRFPVDYAGDGVGRYERGEELRARLVASGISNAFIAYRDNLCTPNSLFFRDRRERPIFSFNRHVGQRDNYILTRLASHQVFGCQNFRLADFPYQKKATAVFWRGMPMGCTNYLDGWALHFKDFVTQEGVDPALRKAILMGFPRFALCLKYFDTAGFDVGFSSDIPGFEFLQKARVSIEAASRSRFQLAIEGNDLASSLPWQLLNHHVTLVPPFRFESIFMFNLVPMVHYVPIRSDLEYLAELRASLEAKPELCWEIAQNAASYMKPFCDEGLQGLIDDVMFERYRTLNPR